MPDRSERTSSNLRCGNRWIYTQNVPDDFLPATHQRNEFRCPGSGYRNAFTLQTSNDALADFIEVSGFDIEADKDPIQVVLNDLLFSPVIDLGAFWYR